MYLNNCPCGSKKKYLSCCEPFITGKQTPKTPEELMRSRYTAYTLADIDYIKKTMKGEALIDFNEKDAKDWAKRVTWIKLHVFLSNFENSDTGFVEFEATFLDGYQLKSIYEKSKFILENGNWYYVSGTHIQDKYRERVISRNQACPCGSERKFKNCHGLQLQPKYQSRDR